MLNALLGVVVGGSVALLVAAAIIPAADTAINATTIASSTGANSLWKMLPLFIIVAIVGVIIATIVL